jgi:thiamine-phosphate diphosphorylase
VVDRASARRSLDQVVDEACAGGVDWIQLRDRELEGAAWLDWAEALAAAARHGAPGVRVLVNRRLDVALAMGADGIHLGFDAMAADDARAVLREGALVGTSTHELAEIRALQPGAVDYVHLAPIYDPHSKPASRPALGPGALAEACALGIPVLAQGGLDRERCSAAIGAGAAGVAVTGAILHAPDPAAAAAGLRAALDSIG